jgi:tRNA dimethylallyltransferase
MKCIIAVVGPTAVGKSQLALYLAQRFNGEIVNADSRQVYRYMDIGTAKPSAQERRLIPHHIIDVVDPDEPFNLAIYDQLAVTAIADIQQRNKIPFLVGGSGMYIWSLIEGWRIPTVAPDFQLRHSLERKAEEQGVSGLFQELQRVDPVAAAKVMPTNLRRIIRALEVYLISGKPISEGWRRQPPEFPILIIGLTLQRERLYQRIDLRVDEMIKQGLVEEVKRLLDKGYGLHLPAMSGIGYKQIGMFLHGQLRLDDAVQQIKWQTHRFVRHQYAWFRTDDPRIHWFNEYSDIYRDVPRLIESFLAGEAT